MDLTGFGLGRSDIQTPLRGVSGLSELSVLSDTGQPSDCLNSV